MLILYPNPILAAKAASISDPKDPAVQALISEMIEAMEQNNGLGIAAPQVGKSLRLCIIRIEGKTYIMINPEIKSKSWKKEIGEEGCLSFPGQFVPIKRHKRVKVKALDEEGRPITIKGEGLFARALQHEIDHLEGITIEERKIKKVK